MNNTDNELRERVQRGAAYLDKNHPGWQRKVDPNRLMMDCACRCVLGQLEGSFWAALTRMEDHGFWSSDRGNYVYLDLLLWREEIESRLTQDGDFEGGWAALQEALSPERFAQEADIPILVAAGRE